MCCRLSNSWHDTDWYMKVLEQCYCSDELYKSYLQTIQIAAITPSPRWCYDSVLPAIALSESPTKVSQPKGTAAIFILILDPNNYHIVTTVTRILVKRLC